MKRFIRKVVDQQIMKCAQKKKNDKILKVTSAYVQTTPKAQKALRQLLALAAAIIDSWKASGNQLRSDAGNLQLTMRQVWIGKRTEWVEMLALRKVQRNTYVNVKFC